VLPSPFEPIQTCSSAFEPPAPHLRCQVERQRCPSLAQAARPTDKVCRERLGHKRACTCERLHKPSIEATGIKGAKRWLGRSSGTGSRTAKPAFADPGPELAPRHRPRPAQLGSARMVQSTRKHPARTCGACIPKSTRYTYSSCSRIILKVCRLISILKTAPNSQF
jgi:hypothetical protein